MSYSNNLLGIRINTSNPLNIAKKGDSALAACAQPANVNVGLPAPVASLLAPGEMVTVTGSYDVSTANIVTINGSSLTPASGAIIGTGTFECLLNNNANHNIMNVSFRVVNDNVHPSEKWSNEDYFLTSQNAQNTLIGSISFSSFYPSGNSPITDPSVLKFSISTTGIGTFAGITSVIVDFRNTVRQMYFVCAN